MRLDLVMLKVEVSHHLSDIDRTFLFDHVCTDESVPATETHCSDIFDTSSLRVIRYVPHLCTYTIKAEFLYPNYDHACLSEVDATNLLNTPFHHLISFAFALYIYIYTQLSLKISPHWFIYSFYFN